MCVGNLKVNPRVFSLRRFSATVDMSRCSFFFGAWIVFRRNPLVQSKPTLEKYKRYLSFLSLRGSERWSCSPARPCKLERRREARPTTIWAKSFKFSAGLFFLNLAWRSHQRGVHLFTSHADFENRKCVVDVELEGLLPDWRFCLHCRPSKWYLMNTLANFEMTMYCKRVSLWFDSWVPCSVELVVQLKHAEGVKSSYKYWDKERKRDN